MVRTASAQQRPRQAEEAVPQWTRDTSTASAGPTSVGRAWDLRPGDHFHGRTVAAVHGVVGLASSPVAVISFTGPEQHSQTRVGATHLDTDRGHDGLRLLARNWVREHRLSEGQAVDLTRLRNDVLTAVTPDPAVSPQT